MKAYQLVVLLGVLEGDPHDSTRLRSDQQRDNKSYNNKSPPGYSTPRADETIGFEKKKHAFGLGQINVLTAGAGATLCESELGA